LILKYRGLTDERVKQRYFDAFAAHGIERTRIELLPATSYEDYLATYNRIDLALDPFPFNGGATTCEAVWMGVPVLTCAGETFPSRHTISYLNAIGATETIATDLDDYVNLAVSLARNNLTLAELRSGLRERMRTSPFCDGERFAADLVALLRTLPICAFG
jgi:predicted O-linked N-acetylglucosamine transferase (SPINDLY family)